MLSNLGFASEPKHARDPSQIRLLKGKSWVPSRWLFGPPLILCLVRGDPFQLQDIWGAEFRGQPGGEGGGGRRGALSVIYKKKTISSYRDVYHVLVVP
jgi:hypothetical protein